MGSVGAWGDDTASKTPRTYCVTPWTVRQGGPRRNGQAMDSVTPEANMTLRGKSILCINQANALGLTGSPEIHRMTEPGTIRVASFFSVWILVLELEA